MKKFLDYAGLEYFWSKIKALLGLKADKTELESGLALKLDKATYEADKPTFALKTEVEAVDAKFADKADKSVVDNLVNVELPKKLDVETYNTDKAGFASASEVEGLKTSKLDKATYDADKPTFALKSELGAQVTAEDVANWNTAAEAVDVDSVSGAITAAITAENLGQYAKTADIQPTLDAVAGKLDASVYNSDKEALEERLGGIEGNVSDNADAIDAINESIKVLTEGVDPEKIDSLTELIDWANTHAGDIEGIKSGIETNAGDIDDLEGRMDTAEQWIEGHKAVDHDFAGADAALKSELEGKINAKLDASVIDGYYNKGEVDGIVAGYVTDGEFATEQERVNGAIALKLDASEIANYYNKTEVDGIVAGYVTDAEFEAEQGRVNGELAKKLEEAALAPYAKSADVVANTTFESFKTTNTQAIADAKSGAVTDAVAEVAKVGYAMEASVAERLALKADKNQVASDIAAAIATINNHNHDNKTVLDGITAEKVALWDAAQANYISEVDGDYFKVENGKLMSLYTPMTTGDIDTILAK